MTLITNEAVRIAKAAHQKALERGGNPMLEALTAAISHLQLGFEVKKLEWVNKGQRHPPAENLYTAEAPFCIYMVAQRQDGSRCEVYTVPNTGFHHKATSLAVAKAAAQADFERRVRECHVVTGTNELLEIEELLAECQGDDEGSQILPSFEEGANTLAKVEACLALLEARRDVIEGFENTKPVDVAASSLWQIASPEELAAGWGYAGTDTDKIRNDAAFDCGYDATLEFTEAVMKIADQRLRALSAEPVQHPDDTAVNNFAMRMKAKLALKREEGRSGWQDMSANDLTAILRQHVDKGDPVDVANLCMMLSENCQRITPAAPTSEAEA